MRGSIATAILGAAIGLLATTAPVGADQSERAEEVLATFEGATINLAEGWGEAGACTSDGTAARCYRTEADMNAAEGESLDPSGPATFATCSASLRLYRGTSYSGGVLQLTTRYTLINLASHGFNNDTSSYRVGPCAATFYDTTTGSGVYPGSTAANVSKATMSSGWDNRIGSVYIA